ncbi:MAG: hypothetical protein ACHQD8_02820 [Chitinophagales bacterium]
MMTDILNAANLYAEGVKHVQERRNEWLKKHEELKAHLKEIAEYLNNNAVYKQGFFVDTLHAFNEDINGTCADMPSITFRSGDMPMLVTFKNSMGERKEYTEDGFHITFNPLITGQLIVLLFPHQSELNKTESAYSTLAVIDDPAELAMDITDQIISKGIEAAYYTSFTGVGEQQQEANEGEPSLPHAQNPIGFKRYETTEQVK